MRGMEERTWDWKPLTACVCPTLLLCLVFFTVALTNITPDTGKTTGDDYSTRIIRTDGADWACLTANATETEIVRKTQKMLDKARKEIEQ